MRTGSEGLMDELEINADSKTPKYKQIINFIINQIEKGKLKMDDRIPSINETSEEFYLSRDTVEKAYSFLKERNIITSVKGKGYFVSNAELVSKVNVCLIFNKLSAHKKIIFNSIFKTLGTHASVDLFVHHSDLELFKNLLKKKIGEYNYYVIMPHFERFDDESLKLLKGIPEDQLIILDKLPEELQGNFGAIYQDFKNDITKTLEQALEELKKYKKLVLVFPIDEMYPYPREIEQGFRKFCATNRFAFDIIDEFGPGRDISEKGEAFVVIEESDLVNIVKKARTLNWQIGKDVGIISYNDTPLKEVLAEGITVISTDFKKMGTRAAEMILKKNFIQTENPFTLIKRKSL
ncbi:GntR family transcriptional regulator [Fulvivirga sp. M361]|uniref:GntR family transcriptional regulator n=1 Tax=Fulvivirga sp. M361 TaxID=2594266 RepID=UPI002104EAC0|nr:GntR family transcriptional regulator [Fulvivirga sp. M361]